MKKRWILLLITVLIVAIGAKMYTDLLHTVRAVTLEEPNLQRARDGEWRGEAKVGPVHVITDVVIQDHRITGIDLLEHSQMLGKKAEVLQERIVQEQKIALDTVSGATASSKAILKAVENAVNRSQ